MTATHYGDDCEVTVDVMPEGQFPMALARMVPDELEKSKAQIILEKFEDFFQIAAAMEKEANAIVVIDKDDSDGMALAKSKRIFLKNKRVAMEKMRKELKQQSLREGKTIDAISNLIKALITPLEDHLQKQENFAKIQEQKRIEALKVERENMILPFHDEENPLPVSMRDALGKFSEDEFKNLLKSSKGAYNNRELEKKQKRLEEEAAAKAKKEEDERIRKENEELRIKAQAAAEEARVAREAEEKEKAEKERIAAELEAEKKKEAKKLEEDERAAWNEQFLPDQEKLEIILRDIDKLQRS
jgi:hypothetical protein